MRAIQNLQPMFDGLRGTSQNAPMTASRITTGQGDGGRTVLYSGEKVSKDDPRIEALGDVDELVCQLGLARSLSAHDDIRGVLPDIQRRVGIAGSEIATRPDLRARLPRRIDADEVDRLTRASAELESRLSPARGFVLPGGTTAAAQIDLARSVARRLERSAVRLHSAGLLDHPLLLVWLNRLSDYLWLIARQEEGALAVRPEPS